MPQSPAPHHDDASTPPLHLLFSSLNLDRTSAPDSESITTRPQSHHDTAGELWNVDVMHIIMSYADRRVVSNLMQTCNALNYAGTRYLLEDGLTLRREESLVSFVCFLYARGIPGEGIRRLMFLNKLTIDFYKPPDTVPPVLEPLFEIFALTTPNLTSLQISAAESLLAIHPPLGTAIAKLGTLKTVRMFQTGVHCATLLRTLRSSLVTAKIHFGVHIGELENGNEAYSEPDINPILLLEGSQSTLESLSVSFAASCTDGPCYPNVTHLELSCMDFPYVEDYVRAYPNLQSLSCFDCAGFQDEQTWHERRDMAMMQQAYYGTWQSLRQFEGSLLILWVWGLTCHIPAVRLSFDQQLGVDPNYLNDIILDVRPSDLALRIPGASWLLDDAVRAVLSEEGRLQVLELCIIFHVDEVDKAVSMGDILGLLTDVVRASCVRTFKLILDLTWMRVVRGRAKRDSGNELPLLPFEVYLQDMDVDAHADTLLESVTSLKEVQISVLEVQYGCTRQADRRRTEPSESVGDHGTNPSRSG